MNCETLLRSERIVPAQWRQLCNSPLHNLHLLIRGEVCWQ